MSTNTPQDRADASSGAVMEHSGAAAPPAADETDLESRIKERRAELIGKIGGLRGDTRREAGEAREKLRAKLSELAHIIKWGAADGWASLGAPLTNKLEEWLTDSARQLSAKIERL